MKHIKKFNESNTDEYYKKIEYVDYMKDSTIIDDVFSDVEIDTIKEIINEKVVTIFIYNI